MTLIFFISGNLSVWAGEAVLPPPGQMVALSSVFSPPMLKGIKVYPDNPLRFDFILDKGDDKSTDDQIKTNSTRLIKYFLASLTIPEKDLWVNLSPYEKDRIVPEAFGQTEMGRDLLAQDYLLKQVTASLLYPEGETGKKFWKKIYALAQEKYGTTDIPVDTFNKVWIVPEKAVVYENGKVAAAYVTESQLKVMLETDYFADEMARRGSIDRAPCNGSDCPEGWITPGAMNGAPTNGSSPTSDLAKSVLREVVIPVLEREVNEGNNFVKLRQVYQSLILAVWYKKKVRQSLLSAVYVDRKKTDGVNISDPKEAEKIWGQYVEAFKKGTYNFVKEDRDMFADYVFPRKYFSGGADFSMTKIQKMGDVSELLSDLHVSILQVRVDMVHKLDNGKNNFDASQETVDDLADVNLSSELSERDLKDKWDAYVAEEGLDKYANLLPLFDRLMKEALLDDRSLRPVFLQVIPVRHKLQVPDYNEELLSMRIGMLTLKEIIENHKVFKIGSPQTANRLLGEKLNITVKVAVVDRYSQDHSLAPFYAVANGRQAYIPLADGRWLGIKGAGLFSDEENTYSIDSSGEKWGVLRIDEAIGAEKGYGSIQSLGGFWIKYLARVDLDSIPDGNGGLVDIGRNALVYNLALTPHRLVKLPQLLLNDPKLCVFRKKLTRTLVNIGRLSSGSIITMADVMERINTMSAVNEAVLQNSGWYMTTRHSQDSTIAAEQADLEELLRLDEYITYLPTQNFTIDPFLSSHGLDVKGISSIVIDLISISAGKDWLWEVDVSSADSEALIPDLYHSLETLFKIYFSRLDSRFLDLWTISNDSVDKPYPKVLNENFETLRRELSYGRSDVKYRAQVIKFLASISTWVQEEQQRRRDMDQSVLSNGGIDLNLVGIDLKAKGIGNEIKFSLDPAQLEQMQNAAGFEPVIIGIQPENNLRMFFGLNESG